MGVVWSTPQGLYSDPAWQLRSLQQFLRAESPTPNHLVQPAPEDLGRDRDEWIFWWPPATQIAVAPLVELGFSLGGSLRLVSALCLLLGGLGWLEWFRLQRLGWGWALPLAALFPWMRYAGNSLFFYSAEVLVFCCAPWALIVTDCVGSRLRERGSHRSAWLLGLGLGALYLVKYSLLLLSLGCLAYLVALIWRSPALPGGRLRVSVWVVAGFVVVPATLSLFNRLLGSAANLVTGTLGPNLGLEPFLFVLANPALALTDAGAFWSFLLLHPRHGLLPNEIALGWVGLPGGIVLVWLLARKRATRNEWLPLAVLLTALSALITIWLVSHSVSYEPRHCASAAFAILPLIIRRATRAWEEKPGLPWKAVLGIFAVLYVGGPLAYGVVSVFAKVARTPSDYVSGASGVFNPLLADQDVKTVRAQLLEGFEEERDIWYLTDPVTALDVPGRALIRHADFLTLPQIRAETFRSGSALGVRLLLPASFEENGKGPAIRRSFPQARSWQVRRISGSVCLLWIAELGVKTGGRQERPPLQMEPGSSPQGTHRTTERRGG